MASEAISTAAVAPISEAETAAFKKAAWRILPLLTAGYIVNFLDRTNISFAALTMNREIGLSAEAFGFGAGILFLGYCFFEVPSNIALYKFGARLWLSRIMITWGLISMAAIFTAGPKSYYLLRFLLGVAEAGFFPGVAFYLSQWFPAQYRARILAWFLFGIPASALIGGPLSSLLLELDGVAGLAGWKWLFLVEGFPAVVLGVLFLIVLVDKPEDAPWLSADEKKLVRARIASEPKERERHHFWASLKDARVLLLALIQFCFLVGSYGVTIFLPLILKGQNFSNFTVGFLSAIPSLVACVAMILWAGAVDRSGRKINGLAATCILSCAGLILAVATGSFLVAFVGLTAAVVGTNTARAIFWSIPTRFLSGIGAAGGLAFINSVGTIGGFVGPSVVGVLKGTTGSFTAGLIGLAAFLAVSVVLTYCLKFVIVSE